MSHWMDDADCANVDPDLFFPGRGESVEQAKAICRGCPVRAECLDHAMTNGERFGIWGGLSERERRQLRRGRPSRRKRFEDVDPRLGRMVLAMRADGASVREIAAATGLAVQTIRNALVRLAEAG